MRLSTFRKAEEALRPFVEVARQSIGKDLTTDRAARLAEYVGNPQNKLKIIHVAGTSGKTSTSYYLAAHLAAAGQKVGLTVSPHIETIAERVQINGENLAEETFCQYLEDFLHRIKTAPETPTYFELMIVFALWVFDKEKVDYVVLETGLGGLHDSSNIARRRDKICVITDIGLDHVEVLGKSVALVAEQKAGIIWPGNQVFCYEQAPEIMDAIKKRVEHQDAKLTTLSNPPTQELFSQRNWHLAHEVFRSILQRDGLGMLSDDVIDATKSTFIPGRMEIIQFNGKTIIFDGAHNEQKMSAFISSLEQLFPKMQPAFLVAFKRSKDIEAPIATIANHTHSVVATMFTKYQDTPFDAHPAQAIVDRLKAYNVPCEAIPDPVEAFESLLLSDAAMIVVTGSFYLVAETRTHLRTKM